MDRLRVAVIGAGGMARRHMEVLSSLADVELAALSSRGVEKLEKLAKEFGIPDRYRDNEQMLEKVRPDAVIVAVSALNNYEVTLSCIKRRVPTLLEKPPGLTVAESERLLQASKEYPGQYMVALNRRFYSIVQAGKKLLDESGGLVSVLVQAPEDIAAIRAMNFHPPEVLTHVPAANGIHCIDLLRFFGGDVLQVHALSSIWRDTVRNSYGAVLRFKSGVIGHYVANWTAPGRWEVTLYGFDMRVDYSPLESASVTRRDGSKSDVPKEDVYMKFKPGFYKQDRFFMDRVKDGGRIERPAADLEDALGTMRLVEAIACSQTS